MHLANHRSTRASGWPQQNKRPKSAIAGADGISTEYLPKFCTNSFISLARISTRDLIAA